MNEKTIDARGLACPQPVILTKRGLNDPAVDVLTVIVDSETAQNNVIMLAKKEKAIYTADSGDDGFYITLSKPSSSVPETGTGTAGASAAGASSAGASGRAAKAAVAPVESPLPGPGRILSPASVLVINSAGMGNGSDELGGILIRGFFHALVEAETKPGTIVFYNGGVKLTVNSSPVLEDLKVLERYGITLLICGTCLDYFRLKDRCAAGTVTNMYTITETLVEADKVINL